MCHTTWHMLSIHIHSDSAFTHIWILTGDPFNDYT
jgi:hypothetical protein